MKKSFRHWTSSLLLPSTVLLASTISGAAPAQAAQTFNVKNFGATGNGVTNDTAAIQAALAAANASPGSTLVFPSGNYLYSSNLTATGIAVVGQHATLTSINSGIALQLSGTNASVVGMTFASQVSNNSAVFVFQANGFEIENDVFNSGFNPAISGLQSTNGEIESNNFSLGPSATAISFGQINQMSVTGNTVSGIASSSEFLRFANSSNVSIASNRVTNVATGVQESSNTTTSCTNNVFSNYGDSAYLGTNDQNLTISQNQFTTGSGAATDIDLDGGRNAKISGNTLQGANVGVHNLACSSVQISGNTITNNGTNAIYVDSDSGVAVSNNSVRSTGTGINAVESSNLSLTGNQISQCQQGAISATLITGTETISNNVTRNCGLSPSGTTAVIFVNSPGATSIPITRNSYTGNSSKLQYFIRCFQPQPPAQVSGNTTNTGLPNLIGP